MKSLLKHFLSLVAPGPTEAVRRLRQVNHVRRFERRLGLPDISRRFVAYHGLKVQKGPFAGMVYVSDAVGSAFVPKLVGSYELELQRPIEQILARRYSMIVDVGCAEGYYAVGLALRFPEASVYAFDTDPKARRLCGAMARQNNVSERVCIKKRCTPQSLDALLKSRALIVCDCEGYEVELLCPDRISELHSADLIVELHDCVHPSISKVVLSRFEATHTITLIDRLERDPALFSSLDFLEQSDRHLAINEFRSRDQQWAFMTAKDAYDS